MTFQFPDDNPVRLRNSESSGLLSKMWGIARSVVLALLLFSLVKTLVLEAFKIPTSSMASTLLPGDFVLVNKAVYGTRISSDWGIPGWNDPERGDVVVFQPPHDPLRNYVKRVIAEPGDIIEMRDGTVFVNGESFVEDYLNNSLVSTQNVDVRHSDMDWQVGYWVNSDSMAIRDRQDRYRPSRDNWGPLRVPMGEFFVLGDNRNDSEDSRYWGFVVRSSIQGKAWFIYYSAEPRHNNYRSWLNTLRWDRIGKRIN
ncbi:uncharacterized protein METZ01_LOCUS228140 [marine metagenome]|uniref:signal peptidase I n=1 Tax=marine metagenome TaxID=408172 RepID=A0A382GJF8_9ZZZZ